MYIHPAFASSTGVLLLSRILFAKLVADHSGQRISEAQFSCGDTCKCERFASEGLVTAPSSRGAQIQYFIFASWTEDQIKGSLLLTRSAP
jgi:hypothetical protein